ncbi:CPBP family intramembrane glutamic endopeptidase [Roseateles sp. UC29_93]|uniref:CPBP family intramembrane glutamic endopeptidase n=1 Tax=Roseateles sp. UC29_93 TaxID=3350177 RepID=UPI003671DD94
MTRDFPFYNGEPVALRPAQWAWLMLAVVAGFLTLYLPIGESSPLLAFVPAVLFPAIPLLVLRAVAGRHWRALFQRVGIKAIAIAVGIALLNLVVTVALGLLTTRFFGVSANPVFDVLAHESTADRWLFALRTLPQLLGEEVLTMLPFLALMTLFTTRAGWSRRTAIVAAWWISALIFGMAHLPTYQWNWVQCVVVIGSARLVLSLAYLWTRNLWVSTLAHVLNDWTLFAAGLLLLASGHASA